METECECTINDLFSIHTWRFTGSNANSLHAVLGELLHFTMVFGQVKP